MAKPSIGKRERALERALTALVDNAEMLARTSFSEFHHGLRVWNDTLWRRADVDGFDLIVAARKALAMAHPLTRPTVGRSGDQS